MLKKLLLIIPILTALTFFLTQSVNAQDAVVSETSEQILTEFCDRRKGDVINLETWYAGTCDSEDGSSTFLGAKLGFGDIIILHVYELLAGEGGQGREETINDIIESIKGLPLSDRTGSINYLALLKNLETQHTIDNRAGLINSTGFIMASLLSRPPVSTQEYIASVQSNMAKHSLVKPAYAQEGGYGFSNFQGFLPMWRAFRNISYFFFVLAFVAYGFAIMFRVKLGQAAVTIQLALPKLITTLLLITFSYAIVGLLIDMMWVLYYVFLNTLGAFGVFGGSSPLTNLGLRLMAGEFGLILSGFIQTAVALFSGLPASIAVLLGLPFDVVFGIAAIGAYLGGVVFLIGLVLLIAVLIAFAKLTIKLISAYVYIIGNLVLAPLILLPDAIPGRGGAFGKWLNNLIANIVVFPVTSLLLLFSGYFMFQPLSELLQALNITPDVNAALSQTPPKVPLLNTTLNFSEASDWMALLGLAILLMSPKLVDMIKGAFGVKAETDLFKEGATAALGGYGAYQAYTEPGTTSRPQRLRAGLTSVGREIFGIPKPSGGQAQAPSPSTGQVTD